ncbi:MAG: MFS transporter [Treponema sp.]|jgi:Na+/melibiose symporter-like transporter|nr:MFS transporter [Treponema sp.]
MNERCLPSSTRWSLALGNSGFFIAMTLYTVYPLVFMTHCLGLAFPLAVRILSITRIIDIIFGFFQGSIIEKVRMPWGKYRSWFLAGPVIAGISTCLFFSPLLLYVPQGFVLFFAVFLLALWNVTSGSVLTAYNAMYFVMIHDPIERIDIFKLSNQLQAVTGAVAGFFMMKIVFAVGGERDINLAGMQVIGVIYSLLYLALFMIFFVNLKGCKDRDEREQRVNIIATVKLLFTNGKAAALTFSGMFSFSAEMFFRVISSFYFLYVLFSPKMLDTYNWTTVVSAFVGASLALPLFKRTSKKTAYIIGYLIMAAALVGAYFTISTFWFPLVCICIGFLGLNIARSVMVPMYSDVSDFSRHRDGKYITSYAMALYMINFKVGGFIAAQASGLLARVGFITGVDPSPEVSRGINMVATFGPAGFALIGALIMLFFYHIDEKQMPRILAELKERDVALK